MSTMRQTDIRDGASVHAIIPLFHTATVRSRRRGGRWQSFGSRCPALTAPSRTDPRTAAPLKPSQSFPILHAAKPAKHRVSAREGGPDGIR